MSCLLLINDHSRLEWIVMSISTVFLIVACIIFPSGATLLLIGFSFAILASVFGLIANRWSHVRLHRVMTVVISVISTLLFTIQMILLIIAFPRILPYIYDRQLAPEPFVLGAIFSAIVVLFGLISSTILAIKYSKLSYRQITSNQPSRFVMLPVDMAPIHYT